MEQAEEGEAGGAGDGGGGGGFGLGNGPGKAAGVEPEGENGGEKKGEKQSFERGNGRLGKMEEKAVEILGRHRFGAKGGRRRRWRDGRRRKEGGVVK